MDAGESMNLALCYERVVPAKGGAEVFIADFIRRLVADRHEVHLYGYERDAASLPREVIFHALLPRAAPRFLRPWRFAAACERALQQEPHDIVLGFNKTWRQDVALPQGGLHAASVLQNRLKYRNGLMRFGARIAKWLDPAHWSYTWLERKQYAGCERPLVIASSRMVAGHFRRFYGMGPDRVRVIPNAVDPARFSEHDRLRIRAEVRERLHLTPDEPTALFVGINYRLKGLEPLLHAVRELPVMPFHLLVCGSGRVRGFKRLARRLGIERQVSFLGYCGEVRQMYFASDFLVHPTFYDPCSLVVLEALACGLPVITSIHNGAGELLHPQEDGIVLEDPHDAKALGCAIERFCDSRVRAAASRAARHTASAWTFEAHYQAILRVIEESTRKRQGELAA
jgi:UDP-glucose:(heptosyl)LPS alpha-1,3-glucosyltransferase